MPTRPPPHRPRGQQTTPGRPGDQYAAAAYASSFSQRLYHTRAWLRFRRMIIAARPVCEDCRRARAQDVHHMRGLEAHPEDAYDDGQVEALCHPCHSRRTARGE